MRGMRERLIPRWYSPLGNIKQILGVLREVLPDIRLPAGPGRPPKHSPKVYAEIIVLKELKRSSLRSAEADWSELVCGERIDHSVIAYWEACIPRDYLAEAVRLLGSTIQRLLGYQHTMIDATAFADWHQRTTSFHLVNRIAAGAVYPVSIAPDTFDPIPNTLDAIIPGHGFFLADRWYDVNGIYKIAIKNGYDPLIKPQQNRCSGRWRRKGRKIYDLHWRTYRQRGRGESVFGSLTNAFGDRLQTRRKRTTYTRSVARVIAYQAKLCIRALEKRNSGYWANN